MRALLTVAALAAALLLNPAQRVEAADSASFDDTAKFLAGMPPSADSPLTPLTKDASWQRHAKHFDEQFKSVESRQVSKARAFVDRNMTPQSSNTLYYMFSGPDFLYADAFFPKAQTYVLSGLERTGPIPDLSKIRGQGLTAAYDHLKVSLRQMLGHGYFITSQMGAHLGRGQLPGTLPVLYLFLARSGKTIKDVSFVQLEPDGTLKPAEAVGNTTPRAVKITFTSASGGPVQTLYYFSTDLANGGVAKSGFLKFCDTLKPGNAFIKSASYLLHGGGFSSVRDFLMANSENILQDDTGVPLRLLKEDAWTLKPYGRYTRPIPVFSGMYQQQMTVLYDKVKPAPLDFSIGYRWSIGQSNLLLATRKPKQASAAP